jgi:NDP-sugar pyrophosphorylase family protein
VTRVGINLHYRPEAVRAFVGDGSSFGISAHFTCESELLGSAGALRPFADVLAGGSPGFVAVYGDTLATLPLGPLISWHVQSGAALTMAVMEHPNPTEAGIVDLADVREWHGGQAGQIKRIAEKPHADEVFSTIANAGVFAVDWRVVDFVPDGQASDLARDLIPRLLGAGERVSGWKIPDAATVWDVGTWRSYERAQREWAAIWARRHGS